jgi:hypothetical protein
MLVCPAAANGRRRPRPRSRGTDLGQTELMAKYRVNKRAVTKARDLIDAGQYRVRSRWADVQPRAAEQNAFLKAHGWAEYASWHLALTDGAPDETKVRYAFVFGDFRRLHRMGLIACYYRAAEWEHTEVMRAAHNLLLYLDKSRSRRPSRGGGSVLG